MSVRKSFFIIAKCILIFLFSMIFFALVSKFGDLQGMTAPEQLLLGLGTVVCVSGVVLTALARDDK